MTLKRPQVKRERNDRRDPPAADLRPGTEFHWKTCGVTIDEWLAGAAGGVGDAKPEAPGALATAGGLTGRTAQLSGT
jgi:hypothetical protein